MQNRNKKKVRIVKKPFAKGKAWEKSCWKRSAGVLGSLLVVALLYLFLGIMLTFDNAFLRTVVNLCLVAASAGIFYMNGMSAGIQDVTVGEIVLQREQTGKDASKEDKDRSYNPMRGVLCGLAGAAIFIIAALLLAVTAKEQTFSLGVLPQWIGGHQRRADIGSALGYYQSDVVLKWTDIIRTVVRVMIMPFVNIVGTDNALSLLWLERISPLLMLIVPAGYALGYLRGPNARTQVHTSIAANRRKKKRKDKQKVQQRRQEKGPERLV